MIYVKKLLSFIGRHKIITLIIIWVLFSGWAGTANAQTINTPKIQYSLTETCELTIQFSYNLAELYTNVFGTSPSKIAQYAGTFPATTTFQGSKTGFTVGTIGQWVTEWQNAFPPVITGNTVTWPNISTVIALGSTYWYWDWADGKEYYASFFKYEDDTCEPVNSELIPVVSGVDFQTKFLDATVLGASSTLNFDVDYFLNTAEYTANTRPDLIQVLVGLDGFGQMALARKLILPLADGTQSVNVPVNYNLPDTKEFIDGDYYAYINFWNITTDTITFNKTNIVLNFTISGGAIVSQNIVSITDGTEISTNIQYQDCSFSNIGGCFINALIFTFVPKPNSFNKFNNLWERIENKAPFGYIGGVINSLKGLNNTATPAFTFGDIPFINDIFTPFRTLLIIALWVLYTLFFMGRLSKIQI
jgi:hypothetical protein